MHCEPLPSAGAPAVLQIPCEGRSIAPARRFVEAAAESAGVSGARLERLGLAVESLLGLLISNNRKHILPVKLEIKVRAEDDAVVVELLNRGYPVYNGGTWTLARDCRINDALKEAGLLVDALKCVNLGRDGQAITLKTSAGPAAQVTMDLEAPADEPTDAIEIRPIRPGEETELSRLFCTVYGYNYVNEYVYYPEKLREMIAAGRLISHVAALPSGRIVGHVGLVRWNESPAVYEAALGLTDPRIKSRGLFTRLLKDVLDVAKTIPMQYCVFDFVTNHDYSQREVLKYGACDMALFVGSQVSDTQAKLEQLGIGADPKTMDRYSILLAVQKHVAHPFGTEVTLPANIGEMTEFLLEPLGVRWVPAPRFCPLPKAGRFEKALQPTQKAVIFDFVEPGYAALKELIHEWRHLRREDYRYCGVDVPLSAAGIGQTYDLLSKNGFFIAGFVPYRFTDQLGIRFQSIGPTRVGFGEIRVCSGTALRLRDLIQQEYERNTPL